MKETIKDFIRYAKSYDGMLSGAAAFLIGFGFGFKIGCGIFGIILYHNVMARYR